VSVSGEQWVHVHRLDADEAGPLERPEGEPFLLLRRMMRGADGQPVEYVESLLDPERFDLHIEFDPRSR
jgi:GntR family transcriptional regulator